MQNKSGTDKLSTFLTIAPPLSFSVPGPFPHLPIITSDKIKERESYLEGKEEKEVEVKIGNRERMSSAPSSRFATSSRSPNEAPSNRRRGLNPTADSSDSIASLSSSSAVLLNKHGNGNDERGLLLRSVPARILSESQSRRLRDAERREYTNLTLRRALPKILELAGRLAPAAAVAIAPSREMGEADAEERELPLRQDQRQPKQDHYPHHPDDLSEVDSAAWSPHSSVASTAPGLKATGLEEADFDVTVVAGPAPPLFPPLRWGGEDAKVQRLMAMVSPLLSPFPPSCSSGRGGGKRSLLLPQGAAVLAASGMMAPSLEDDVEERESPGSSAFALAALAPRQNSSLLLPPPESSSLVDVSAITASLDADLVLLDLEADALIRSLRDDAIGSDVISSPPPSSLTITEARCEALSCDDERTFDDSGSMYTMETLDTDDGMGGELRRLGDVVDSLRKDLASDWNEEEDGDGLLGGVTGERGGGHWSGDSNGGRGWGGRRCRKWQKRW